MYGFLWYSGIGLNSMNVANVILAQVLVLFNSILLAKAYDTSIIDKADMTKRQKRKERVKYAITRSGAPAVHISVTLFLLLLPLAASQAYVFQSFFKVWIFALFSSLIYSMMFLPVTLSFFGCYSDEQVKQ